MQTDSDTAPLEHQPRLRVPYPWRRWAENLFVIGCLIAGGFGFAAAYYTRAFDTRIAQIREDHLAEITRLQTAYANRLESAASQATNAADKATTAAESATEAANTAKSAAEATKKPTGGLK